MKRTFNSIFLRRISQIACVASLTALAACTGTIGDEAGGGPGSPGTPGQPGDPSKPGNEVELAGLSSCNLDNAVATRYAELGGSNGSLGRCAPQAISLACVNEPWARFQNGSISETPEGTTFVTMGRIDAQWHNTQGRCGALGLPVAEQETSSCAKGDLQRFANGLIFARADGTTPAADVRGAILAKWQEDGAECGIMGMPLGGHLDTECNGGAVGEFESGSISWSAASGAHLVYGEIRNAWLRNGRECGTLGFPTSDETASSCGGRFNSFEKGAILYSPASGAHISTGAFREMLGQLGWECGAMGFPTTDETTENGIVRQGYQNGFMELRNGRAETVHNQTPSLALDAFGTWFSPGVGGTYARATPLANGEFLGFYETGGPAIRTTVSKDNGWTWEQRSEVVREPPTNARDLANPHGAQIPGGRVVAAVRHHDTINGRRNYRILAFASDDNGLSWRFLATIEAGANPIWEPFVFVAADNSVQIYYARENLPREGGENQQIVMKKSYDGGVTWGPMIVVASSNRSRDGMPGVARLNDGSIIVIIESWRNPGNPKFVIRTVQSNDNGNNWGNRRDVYVPGNASKNAGSPDIRALPDGRLVASFMTDEDAGPQDWPNHASTKVLVTNGPASFNNVPWAYPAAVAAGPGSYWPGLAVSPSGQGYVMFDQGGMRIKRLFPR